LEKDKDLSLLTSCEKYEKLALFEDQTSLSSTNLTIEQCRSQCANKDTVYATLTVNKLKTLSGLYNNCRWMDIFIS